MRSSAFVFVLTALGPLQGATADATSGTGSGSDPFWVLQGGLELDEEGGYAINTGVSYLHSEQTTAALSLGFSDSAADLADFQTSYASALIDHSFGPVGGSISVGWAGDADVVERFRYGGSVYFEVGGFRLEFIGEDWTSEFEPFEFSTLIEREPPLPPLRLEGTGKCSLDNTAYGGHASFNRGAWSIYSGATEYDYAQADCAFSGMLGNIDLRNPPDVLTDFSPVFFRRLAVATASQIINNDVAFLDRSFSAGMSFQVGDKSLSLDYFHSQEIFAGLTADTLIGGILFPVGLQTDWELRVGATDHEDSGVVLFIGATVYWYAGW